MGNDPGFAYFRTEEGIIERIPSEDLPKYGLGPNDEVPCPTLVAVEENNEAPVQPRNLPSTASAAQSKVQIFEY